ncbi:hypothetical protein BHH47_02575 [Salmonella enterica]|uniref:Uncharacterized protein n=1 Tax=Salmonella enterica TaxID=28901 RepID=A0A704QSH4_SALER|nr:hypothetical protein [Salmonella enterica]ECS7551545.1 hypothetical protein [Salmonella enterica subsp. enterica serovar Typhimurium]EEN1069866.1 DinI-like family protein [Salmonella enterica subsp. enterica]MCM7692669.1 DinI-like family protein [Enterobacter hormaechei]EAT4615927.1 hypothetical protein [Salmonella enterica]
MLQETWESADDWFY